MSIQSFLTGGSESTQCQFPNTAQQRLRKYSLLDSYQMVAWAYACINAIADAISGVPIIFYTGDEDNRTVLGKDHEVWKLFSPPKQWEIPSMQEYIKMIYINLGVFGEIFTLPEKGPGSRSKPVDVSIRSPVLFTATEDPKTGDLKGWEYDPKKQGGSYAATSQKKKILGPGEVMQFRYYSPYARHRGLSPLNAGRLSIEQEINMSIWNAGFFQGGHRNPLAIMLKNVFGSRRQREQYKEQLRKDFTGFLRGQGALFVEGGAEVKPLLQSLKDLDFIEGKSLTREEICALFGVPPAQVGIFRYANYANSREQTRLFWVNTLLPKMRNFRDTLQAGLLDIYWPEVKVDWDLETVEALRIDPVQDATAKNMISQAVRNYMEMGYDENQVAEILEVPALALAGKPKKPTETPKEELYIRVNEVRIEKNDRGANVLNVDPGYLDQYAKNYQTMILRFHANQYLKFVRTFTKGLLQETARTHTAPDIAKAKRAWLNTIKPMITRLFVAGFRQACEELDAPDNALSSFLTKPSHYHDDIIPSKEQTDAAKFFSKNTGARCDMILSYLDSIHRSGMSELFQNDGEAIILTMLQETEARWIVSRVYHYGRMVAHEIKGVETHQWASHECPNPEHQKMSGKVEHLHQFFSSEVGPHPSAMDKHPPKQVCTCTTFPLEVSMT